MRTLLKRAVEPGEIPTPDLPARVVAVPADLLRYEMPLSTEPVTGQALTAIVDDVFLPRVRQEARTFGGDGAGL
ncbi:TetR/AcrR family transcriptional regulator C-terminal ligand-binding domain-containing protein [Streptomyces sp. 7R007]